MKTILPKHYALSVCVAATMLVGCGGSTQFPNSPAQASFGSAGTAFHFASPSFATPERMRANSSGNEALTGKAKITKPCHAIRGPHGKRQGSSTTFSAHGNATGPYPGAFTASGSWEFFPTRFFHQQWTFNETFTITSGSSTISGTAGNLGFYGAPFSCTVVENLTVPYTSGSVSGNALINIIQKQDFSETLDGL
ncbi:MAG: hypothetical protein WCB99_05730 [Candidatus Cybelea sp.]|jgi:hypothetical protein